MFWKSRPQFGVAKYIEKFEKRRVFLCDYCIALTLRHGKERWPLVLVVRYPFTQRIMYAKFQCFRQGRLMKVAILAADSIAFQISYHNLGAPTASHLGRVQHPRQPRLRRWIDVGVGTKCCRCCPAWCGHAGGYSCHRMCQCSHSPSMSWSGVTGRFFWLNDGACSGAKKDSQHFSTILMVDS